MRFCAVPPGLGGIPTAGGMIATAGGTIATAGGTIATAGGTIATAGGTIPLGICGSPLPAGMFPRWLANIPGPRGMFQSASGNIRSSVRRIPLPVGTFPLALRMAPSQMRRFATLGGMFPRSGGMTRGCSGPRAASAAGLARRRLIVGIGRVGRDTAGVPGMLSRVIWYDAALVTLELAVVFLREGTTAMVKTLAAHMKPIFQSQGVHREAMAALTLFRKAAEQEKATLDLAERLVTYLRKARNEPELKFPGA
jgi:hypothetical protein